MLILCGCGGAPAPETAASNQKLVIRIATDYRDDSIGYRCLQDFAHLVQDKSGNTVQVKLYHTGEWSNAESFIPYVRMESLDMACLEAADAMALQPEFAVYSQPYLFSSLQEVQNYISGEAGRAALNRVGKPFYAVGFMPDGYAYLLNDGEPRWISGANLKKLGQTKALEGVQVYNLKALYRIQPLITSAGWWEARTEEEQTWITDSLREAVEASFAQQEDKDPVNALQDAGATFVDSSDASWGGYSSLYLNQRELYFAEHSDALTLHWRPVTVTQNVIEGDEVTP